MLPRSHSSDRCETGPWAALFPRVHLHERPEVTIEGRPAQLENAPSRPIAGDDQAAAFLPWGGTA